MGLEMNSKSKFRNPIILNLLLVLLFSIDSSAQGGTAVPFLIMPASPSSIGMGGTGVALPSADAYNVYSNPAQLGINSQTNNFSISFYPSNVDFNPEFTTDVTLYNWGFQFGYNFRKDSSRIPLSIGAGFLRQSINLGQFTRTNDSGIVLGKFKSDESANSFIIGAALDYWVKIAAGITFKHISSNLIAVVQPLSTVEATTGAFDFGVLLSAPVIDNFRLSNSLYLNGNASVGYTLANFGSELDYNGEKDPLPRTARLGYGLNLALKYKFDDRKIFNVISLDWAAEANDILINRDSKGYSYKNMLGDINIIDNVLLLKDKSTVQSLYGGRISFLETLKISYGHFGDNLFNKTFGLEMCTDGIFKFLNNSDKYQINNFITNHLSLAYFYGSLTNDSSNGLMTKKQTKKYHAIYLGLKNLNI